MFINPTFEEAIRILQENISPLRSRKLTLFNSSGKVWKDKRIVLMPHVFSVLSSYGQYRVEVFTSPRISIITFGNSMVSVKTRMVSQKHRDVYTYPAYAFASLIGRSVAYKRVSSTSSLKRYLHNFMKTSDLVILFSEETHDHHVSETVGTSYMIKNVMHEPGGKVAIWKRRKKVVLRISKEPLEYVVSLFLYGLGIVRRMVGLDARLPSFLFKTSIESKEDVDVFLPGRFEGGSLEVFENDLSSFLRSNCFVRISKDIPDGEVEVFPLVWYLF